MLKPDPAIERGRDFLDEENDLPPAVDLIRASDIKPEPIKWLWPWHLARGKLHILAGHPGTGKTTLAVAVAAILAAGGDWPDGTRATASNVLIWSGEDDPADVLVPRLIAAGADLNRVHVVNGVTDSDGKRSFDPANDIDALLTATHSVGNVALLIVDPIISAVSGDSHKNAETRRALQPLVDYAKTTGAAVLGISHFSKGTAGRDPLERLSGSLAFGALARLVFAAAVKKTGDGEDERVFLRIKSNIGPDGGGFAYRLEYKDLGDGIHGSHVVWGETIQGHARDVLADYETQPDGEDRSALQEAEDFLRELLATGPVLAKQIFSEGRDCGHAEKTLRRAQKTLGIKAIKRGFGKDAKAAWYWEWPTEDGQKIEDGHDSETRKHGHLRETWPSSDEEEVF